MAAQSTDSRGAVAAKPAKKIRHRAPRDYSQRLRRAAQFLFLALNLWIGAEFYGFVRYCETAGAATAALSASSTGAASEAGAANVTDQRSSTVGSRAQERASRPPGVEGWLPIAGLMNLKLWLSTGRIPAIHPAGMFLLISFLVISVLFRKAFCAWLCPVGTVSELLWRLGRKIFRRNFELPRWADIPLRGVKYLLFGFFLYAVARMSVLALQEFLGGPYGLIADVKMLNFFRDIGVAGIVALGALAALSVFIQNFWCRYLCPYGALLGLAALVSPLRIRRDDELCIDCAKCAKACPAALPVDRLVSIRSAECTGCLECVAVCPAGGALYMSLPSAVPAAGRSVPAWAMAAGIALVFLAIAGYARATGHWQTDIPARVYFELVPRAAYFAHP
jgi:polyferredoxin